ncbi:hypothetical protein M3A49_21290 [Paraburkholderia sp. CNPSo 3076]|uniref:hypothetical protein n=1 Tax=Paraburkholderia sp. CNPSo 3076 TaxID=2940936 RepID=UPI00224E33CB|nr:hypothetical protein [Paraburkholderia sp. CNPSo 3076]MCX5542015.1 hypothetical protein [Paraburkholderia sp. CNPSo 3076]
MTMSLRARLFALCFLFAVPLAAFTHEQTLLEYADQCVREIGEIPPFNCNDGTDIPITIDGKPPGPNESPTRCDKPSLLSPRAEAKGQCVPFSKILNLSRGNTQISAYCRRDVLREDKSQFYDLVVVVMHHSGNGKTCWFASKPPPLPQSQADVPASSGIVATRVPPPNERKPPSGQPSAVEFWATPAMVASSTADNPTCLKCHDAGPFIFSPYIGQVWDKVPTDPWGKYSSIGQAFSSYHLMTMSTPGNTCVGCHRIGSEQSCTAYLGLSVGKRNAPGGDQLASSYPLNHWMPTDNAMSNEQWDKANVASVEALLACCRDPAHKDANCAFTPMPSSSTNRASH